MNFKGHAIGAGAGAVGFAGGTFIMRGSQFSSGEYMILAATVFLAGIFPDLDVGSIPARWFGRIGFAMSSAFFGLGVYLRNLGFLIYSSLPGMIALLAMAMKHRGSTHKHWGPAFLLCLAFFGVFQNHLSPIMIVGFAIGWEVHLLLDLIFPWSLKGWIP